MKDSESNLPLEFAALSLTSFNSTQHLGGTTNINGQLTLSPQSGKWILNVTLIGYKPYRQVVQIPDSTLITILMNPDDPLAEVVVTARESRNATSASVIDTTAMKHLQPSSFSDLLELLPGHVSHDPNMGTVNTINLRQASNITSTTDYATASLGTSFVIDGVPLNTNPHMITTPDNEQTGRLSVGKGVDMRSISTDDIEKVEIIRGIPSVEYGELTSGLVNIKRKTGITKLQARFKADNQSQLFYLGKGFSIAPYWIINIGADYLDAKIDPRNNRENYKRVTASVRSDKRWNNELYNFSWNSALSYSGTFERDYNDPDLTVNNTIDSYKTQNNSVRWNNTFQLKKIENSFFREVSATTGVSYSHNHLYQQKHVAPSRIMPLPVSTTPGSNYVGYLPMLYLADYNVYGKPFTAFAKLSATFRANTNNLSNLVRIGCEWNMSKNYGKGAVYDITRPLTAGNNTRPRAFNFVPAMHQLSAYIENRSDIHAALHTISITAGVRNTQLLNLGHEYKLQGKPYFDPRVTATWVPAPTYLRNNPIKWEIAGGFGWHTKMPVAAYLFPDKIYSDFEQLNYYHNEERFRTMNVMTFVEDFTNYNLEAARNLKWEVRADASYLGNRISVTYFREDMKNGFRHAGTVHRYVYNRYDASGFDPYAVNRAPVIEELPFTTETHQNIKSHITNGSRTRKEGVEYTVQTRRIPSLKTRLTINGAYFRTINNNSSDLWYKPSIVVNNRELQYIGLYDDEDGSIYRSFNTNFMFDTDIHELNLNFSLSIQNQWFTSRETLWRDGIPTHYLDPDGNLHLFTEQHKADPYLSQLIRKFTDTAFERQTIPLSTTFNIKATKSFWNNRVGLALYVNRILTIEPNYERYGVTMRRYSSPYFGMELNFKI